MSTLSLWGAMLLAAITGAFVVPNPAGKYNVSLSTGALTDYTRNESNTTSEPRTLMLSIFEPTACGSTVSVPYMPDETADFQGPFLQTILNTSLDVTPLFRQSRLPVCPQHKSSCQPEDDFPILLFSPGYSIPRLYYNYLASGIASEGFTVITIDHPNDTNFILYPDGRTSINNDTDQSLETILPRLHPRIADVSFLIDQLNNATAIAELLPHRSRSPHTDRIAMLGHSLGGITAVLAAEQEPRLQAVINWDGAMIEVPSSAILQPVLLMSRGILFDNWNSTWPSLEGPKLWVDIANATHFTFSDAATLFKAAGQDITPYEELLGTIPSEEMVKILVDYAVSWLSSAFEDDKERHWRDVQKLEFPEVTIVKEDNL